MPENETMIVSLERICLSEVDRINADFETFRRKPPRRRDSGDPYRLRPASWYLGIECPCCRSKFAPRSVRRSCRPRPVPVAVRPVATPIISKPVASGTGKA